MELHHKQPHFDFGLMRRKGALAGMSLEQVIKIILGVVLAAGILMLIVPVIFGGVEATCSIISEVLQGFPAGEQLLEYLNMLEC